VSIPSTAGAPADSPSNPPPAPKSPKRTWYEKFRDAFRGVRSGMRGQKSFQVHLAMTIAVLGAAALMRMDLWQWCVLLLCIAGVLTSEMFNSALEHMAKVIDKDHNPELGESLDTASAAVLFACIGSAIIGAMVFISRLIVLLKS
jgi:diacylglycerol kinase